MNWISTKEQLPLEGKFVLGWYNRGNWKHPDKNVNVVVVTLKKGISKEEREVASLERKKTYKQEDEDGNNLVPYCWNSFGAISFFGQDISYWCEISNTKYLEVKEPKLVFPTVVKEKFMEIYNEYERKLLWKD